MRIKKKTQGTMSSDKKAKQKNGSTDGGNMTLSGHLKELRNRVAVCILALVVGICVCLYFSPQLVELLTNLGSRYNYTFVYLKPQELLMTYFSISLLGGLVLSVPVIGYEIYAFCGPGLEKKEQMTFLFALIFGGLCFLLGVAFAYFVTVPFMLNFLIQFSVGTEIKDSISIGEYMNFLLTVFLIFGIVFEMPMISVILTRIGILKAEWMVKARKVMIVVIFFVAAIITPPDIVSQIMVAIPMIGLYQLSIFLSRLVGKRKREAAQEEEE